MKSVFLFALYIIPYMVESFLTLHIKHVNNPLNTNYNVLVCRHTIKVLTMILLTTSYNLILIMNMCRNSNISDCSKFVLFRKTQFGNYSFSRIHVSFKYTVDELLWMYAIKTGTQQVTSTINVT